MQQMTSEERIRSAASLEALGRDLTQLAEEDQLGLVYERVQEIKALATLLSTGENNVVLVGKSGVGKNAIVEGLAKWITLAHKGGAPGPQGAISPFLKKMRIIETGADAFQFGCYYAHEFETKLNYIIEECKNNNAILFLDNINLVISAGKTGDAPDRSLANLLSRHLSGKELMIIGATTPEGYETMLKDNPSFTNRFVKLEIQETTPERSKAILRQLKPKFQTKFKVKIENKSLDTIVDLSTRFFPERCLPGKAFELLSETISRKVLSDRKAMPQDVYTVVKDKTGFPDFIVHRDRTIEKEKIRAFFADRLFGQDRAIDAIVDSVLDYKAELNDPNKPIGTFLFAGPTGAGKTELARLLAEYLFGSKERLHKYDMPSYADPEGIARLIGGTRPSAEPGKLIGDTMADPCCVTLFDEIEKAHPAIFNLLLPVLDEGRLVDSVGRVVNFTNSIIIMTSNLGAELYLKRPIGIPPSSVTVSDGEIFQRIKERFSPEFINRIGRIIYFKPLLRESVIRIVRKELNEIFSRSGFVWRSLKPTVDEKVIDLVIERGYSKEYGARAIQRAIREEVVYPLASVLSSNNALRETDVRLTVDGGRVKVVT